MDEEKVKTRIFDRKTTHPSLVDEKKVKTRIFEI